MSANDRLRVSDHDLRWRCDAHQLRFETTEEVEPLDRFVGQDDAIDALRFGLELFAPGQNVYVRGLTGTGRKSLVRRILETTQPACPLASDYAYVASFEHPGEAALVELPRSRGAAFRDALDGFIEFLRKDMGPALSSERLIARRQFLDQTFEAQAKGLTEPFEAQLRENDLTLVSVQVGKGIRQVILPLIDGEPAPPERLQQLVAEKKLVEDDLRKFEERINAWGQKLEGLSAKLSEVALEHASEVRDLVRRETRDLLESELRTTRAAFPGDDVQGFLDALVEDIVRRGVESIVSSPDALRRYRVNVVLGHAADEGCPIVVETTPTLTNLLGTIDRIVRPEGTVLSDHLMIQAGSLLRADGGFLILDAREVLREPGAWKVLLRTLRTGKLEIVPPEAAGIWGARTLKPEPIQIQVKVILIGDPGLYYALDGSDPDFPHLFKVLADFDSEIPRCGEGVGAYAGILSALARSERLPHFHRSAVAAIAEHGARIAGRNDRLTTRFGRLVDIAREAAFLASKGTGNVVEAEHVTHAIRRTKHRSDLPARKFRERIADGTIHVSTDGAVVGQVNGLAVLKAGLLTYGFPCRITSTIGAGHAGAINIERESQLSGAIHHTLRTAQANCPGSEQMTDLEILRVEEALSGSRSGKGHE